MAAPPSPPPRPRTAGRSSSSISRTPASTCGGWPSDGGRPARARAAPGPVPRRRPAATSGSAARLPVPPLGATAAADPDALAPAVPYRFGPRERSPLVGLALSPAGSAFEAGVAGTDPVGRLDWIAVGAASSGGAPKGAAVGAGFRGLPIEMSFHLFTAELAPSEQGKQGHAAGRAPVPRRARHAPGARRRAPLGASLRTVFAPPRLRSRRRPGHRPTARTSKGTTRPGPKRWAPPGHDSTAIST